jgi:hypothetical protein
MNPHGVDFLVTTAARALRTALLVFPLTMDHPAVGVACVAVPECRSVA